MTLFEFSDFLDLADQLSAHSDEAAWRSAVSRAYYAILHVAYEALPVPMRLSISHGAIHRQTCPVAQCDDASSRGRAYLCCS